MFFIYNLGGKSNSYSTGGFVGVDQLTSKEMI